jgi:hypothetical protein
MGKSKDFLESGHSERLENLERIRKENDYEGLVTDTDYKGVRNHSLF